MNKNIDDDECISTQNRACNNTRFELLYFSDCCDNTCTYMGTLNTTIDGDPCRRWDEEGVMRVSLANLPDASISDAANYCRDPGGEGILWCYIRGLMRYFCRVPMCDTGMYLKHI
jgi:hypothetical protein